MMKVFWLWEKDRGVLRFLVTTVSEASDSELESLSSSDVSGSSTKNGPRLSNSSA